MNNEIFIENRKLDVSNDISSLISYLIDDVKDFGARNSTVSKTIVLPGTANNNALLGHAFEVTTTNQYNPGADNVGYNFNAAVSAQCLIFQNHLQVFKGTMRLLEIVVTNGVPEYEVAVFGELGGLVAALGSGKLEDLDFSAYDTTLTVSGITGSWDNINGSGVCWPLIDYGTVSSDKINYSYRAFRPALYAMEYVDKIITEAGYTYECDLMNTARFKSLVIPHNQKELRSIQQSYVNADRDDVATVVSNSITQANVSFETFVADSWTTNGDKSEFTYTGSNTATFRVKFRIAGVSALFWAPVYCRLRKNNVDVIPNTLLLLNVLNDAENYIWEKEVDVTLNTGDYLALWMYWGTVGVANTNLVTCQTGSLQITALTPVFTAADIGDPVQIENVIPQNIFKKDFLSSIVKLFNLYVYEDKYISKKLLIKPYVDFYDMNASGMVDWSYKMDRGQSYRLKPLSELNARYYDFKFKDDGDYYNDLYKKRYSENYGSYAYDSGFEFANDRAGIELVFASTPLVGYDGKDKVLSTILKINSGVEETTDSVIRILQAKKITGVTSWNILNGVSVLSSQTAYCYAGHYDDPDAPASDIHFGVPRELFFTLVTGAINVTQFNLYWSSYMAEITDKDSKLLTGAFRLTSKDIFDLDFGKPVYLDGALWRLNKIIDYNASEPDTCKVELLKIINLIY